MSSLSRLAAVVVVAVVVTTMACTPKTPPTVEQPVDKPAPGLTAIRIAPRTPTPADEQPPLLILMHGVGSNERDLASLAPQLDPRLLIYSVRAPNVLGTDRFGWFALRVAADGTRTIDAKQAEASRLAVLRFIDDVVARDNVDPARVYVGGFSQGGIMAMSLALTAPEKLAGAIDMSGRILDEVKSITASDDRLSGLPVLVVHGTDDATLGIEHGRASRALLEAHPVVLTYRELPMGHTITPASLAVVSTWLTTQLDSPTRSQHGR